jgi:hypothetical protein
MHDAQLADQTTTHWPSPLPYCISILVQAVLFLVAAAALTLFYLSYRPADFSQSLIINGFLMTPPWFLLTLLPTFLGLSDKELRREILVRQIFTVGAIVVLLIGFSIFLDFHHELWDQIVSMALRFREYCRNALHAITSYASTSFNTLTALFNAKVLPLFAG